MEKKRGRGRPPKDDGRLDERLELRIETSEKAAYDAAAEAAGLERSAWIRTVLNAAAKRAVRK